MDKKRIGRPPLSSREPSVPITVNVPASQYDALARQAMAKGVGLATHVRQRLFSNENLPSRSG